MDIIARLIIALVAALSVSASWSFGRGDKPSQTVYTCSLGSQGSSAADACSPEEKAWAAGHDITGVVRAFSCSWAGANSPTRWVCSSAYNARGEGYIAWNSGAESKTDFVCGANTTELPNGLCECNLGYKPGGPGGKCEQYSCPVKGAYSVVTQPDIEVQNVGVQCTDGCEVMPSSVKGAPDGKLYAIWPFVSQGKLCGGKKGDDGVKTGETKIRDAPVRCGASQCPGSVNGVAVCVPCASTTVPGASTSASGVPTTGPGGVNIPDGGTSTTNTTCTQSSCTTTTTVTDKDGKPVGTTSQEKPKESFCQENPNLQICKDGKWGGTCGAYFCDGDAVQCALSLQVHKSACEWSQVDPVVKAAGEAAMAAGDRPPDHPANTANATSMSFGSVISTTDLLGGGGCPSDLSFSVAGSPLVIPFGKTCDSLRMLGNICLGICMLAAAFIVFR